MVSANFTDLWSLFHDQMCFWASSWSTGVPLQSGRHRVPGVLLHVSLYLAWSSVPCCGLRSVCDHSCGSIAWLRSLHFQRCCSSLSLD